MYISPFVISANAKLWIMYECMWKFECPSTPRTLYTSLLWCRRCSAKKKRMAYSTSCGGENTRNCADIPWFSRFMWLQILQMRVCIMKATRKQSGKNPTSLFTSAEARKYTHTHTQIPQWMLFVLSYYSTHSFMHYTEQGEHISSPMRSLLAGRKNTFTSLYTQLFRKFFFLLLLGRNLFQFLFLRSVFSLMLVKKVVSHNFQ